jgi:glutaredoxin
MLVLTLYGRHDCELCEEMKAVIREVAVDLPHELEEIDVSGDPELERRFGMDVPVLFVNGRFAFRHRVSPTELGKLLRRDAG